MPFSVLCDGYLTVPDLQDLEWKNMFTYFYCFFIVFVDEGLVPLTEKYPNTLNKQRTLILR